MALLILMLLTPSFAVAIALLVVLPSVSSLAGIKTTRERIAAFVALVSLLLPAIAFVTAGLAARHPAADPVSLVLPWMVAHVLGAWLAGYLTLGTGFMRAGVVALAALVIQFGTSFVVRAGLTDRFVEVYSVRDNTLAPTLQVGDRLIVDKTMTPTVDAVVLFRHEARTMAGAAAPTSLILARVLAVTGDELSHVDGGRMLVRGRVLNVTMRDPIPAGQRYFVPEGYVYVSLGPTGAGAVPIAGILQVNRVVGTGVLSLRGISVHALGIGESEK